jgi:hypothetical protein
MKHPTSTFLGLIALTLAAGLAQAQIDPYKPLDKSNPPAAVAKVKPGEAQGFNPQPEPPGKAKLLLKPGEAQGFNPQPDPPGVVKSAK